MGLAGLVMKTSRVRSSTSSSIFVDVDAVVGLGGAAHLGLAGARADAVGAERVLALHDVVARLEEGLVDQVQHLVGAAAQHQPLRLDPAARRDGRAQRPAAAVGIEVELAGGGQVGLARLRAAAQDVLVAGQLDRVGDALGGRLARLVGRDVEDAGLGQRPVGGGASRRRTGASGRSWRGLLHAAVGRRIPARLRRACGAGASRKGPSQVAAVVEGQPRWVLGRRRSAAAGQRPRRAAPGSVRRGVELADQRAVVVDRRRRRCARRAWRAPAVRVSWRTSRSPPLCRPVARQRRASRPRQRAGVGHDAVEP